MSNADIIIEAVNDDGTKTVARARGDVHIRMENRYEYSMYGKDHFVYPADYTLSSRLREIDNTGSVIRIEKITEPVIRSVTTLWAENVNVKSLAKRLGVPAKYETKIDRTKKKITFSWEE